MKEKRKKEKRSKKHKKEKRRRSSSSSSSDEWVEKKMEPKPKDRDDWMSMTGLIKTYTKDDIKPNREDKDKKHIDSYNPSTSSRELNPYWKDGGTGIPQTSEAFRKSRQFLKPADTEDDYYSKSRSTAYPSSKSNSDKSNSRYESQIDNDNSSSSKNKYDYQRSSKWRKVTEKTDVHRQAESEYNKPEVILETEKDQVLSSKKPCSSLFLSNEKMNKLAAKIVKAEIMGNTELVNELKNKLEAAREYRKQNPDVKEEEEEEDSVMLIQTNSAGNSRPLVKGSQGDPRSKGGKRKAETHTSGERSKYFGNDDKYDLAQMFQEEKYGRSDYDDEAQLAKVAGKLKNPNDDLEDIFMDDISKNKNVAKESEKEKRRAINQHVKVEKSLEGCEYCLDSKKMLKHLMVSCGSKVYLALPSRKSMVKGQCFITTIQHNLCVTSLDEDVWEEIMEYRKALTQFYNSQGKDVVFYETATRLHRFPHIVINCVPLPRDVGDVASIYFKKALLDCEAEWSMNKKVVDLKGKGIRKGIPKGLPYFWIDFGMDPGFAHVIEDQQLFPKTFAEEVISGILDLDHHLWKNPQKEYGDLQRKKVVEFVKEWKPFDINKT